MIPEWTGMDRNDTGMDRNEIHFRKHTHVSDWFSKTFLSVLVLKFLCCGLGGMKSLLQGYSCSIGKQSLQ